MSENLRAKSGRFVSNKCPDPNCGGQIVRDVDRWGTPVLRCDGLTHAEDDSPLIACDFQVEISG